MDLKLFGAALMGMTLSLTTANAESFESIEVNGTSRFTGKTSFFLQENDFYIGTGGVNYLKINQGESASGKTAIMMETGTANTLLPLQINASIYQFNSGKSQFTQGIFIGDLGTFDISKSTDVLRAKGNVTFDLSDDAFLNLNTSNQSTIKLFYQDSYNQLASSGINGYTPMKFKANQFYFENGQVIVDGKILCHDEIEVSKLTSENLNAGQINAKDINVELNNAADYVFEDNYNLKSLKEVESYVKENKHLPGVPSAAEISENGMSISQMSNLLLEKVEELTLHMIQLQKENEALKAKVESMEK